MSQPVTSQMSETVPKSVPEHPNQSIWGAFIVEVVSGGTGGAAGIAAATPFMYFKMYMQQMAKNPQNPPVFQKNPVKWFSGASGLAGWMFPQTAFAFTMNEWMRKKMSDDGSKELSILEKLFCSGATGAMTSVLVTPQELIWTLQKKAEEQRQKMIEAKKLDPKQVPSKTATQVATEVWKTHGFKGFYRAGGETMMREVVSTTVLTYLAKEYPILAPVIGATLSQPLDGRKTNKQIDFSYKAPLKELFSKKAFSGLLVGRLPVYLVFMNVAPYVKDKVEAAFKDS